LSPQPNYQSLNDIFQNAQQNDIHCRTVSGAAQSNRRYGTRVNGKAEQGITFHQSFFIGFRNGFGNVE